MKIVWAKTHISLTVKSKYTVNIYQNVVMAHKLYDILTEMPCNKTQLQCIYVIGKRLRLESMINCSVVNLV